MQTPNWREEIVKRYEEDANVHSPANFTAMLRAIDSAYKVGEKESIERAIEVVEKNIGTKVNGEGTADYKLALLNAFNGGVKISLEALKTLLH